MKTFFLLTATLATLAAHAQASGKCVHFTDEHVDLLGIVWNGAARELSLLAMDDTRGLTYRSNECVTVCPETMKWTLPGGTPLGAAGDPLWILPQNPYDGVPYVGVSAEAVPGEVFQTPLTIRLLRLEGPGHLILWQTGAGGAFDLSLDTRDGLTASDTVSISAGAHAHYNWGFTTSGVYRAYFQVSAVPAGQSAVLSPETPFTFQVLPLRPFEHWTATNWPCECAAEVIAQGADPDKDGTVNLLEYAFGNDPKTPSRAHLPTPVFVNQGGSEYGALQFHRALDAWDLRFEARAADTPEGSGVALTHFLPGVTNGAVETVTVRDVVAKDLAAKRFFQLRVQLTPP